MKAEDRNMQDTSEANSTDQNLEEPRVARAYNVPATPSSQIYAFLATSPLNEACRRAVIGLVKYTVASILRQIQRAINQACREKGQILQAARKT
jgi:hypothetical protein